MRRILGGGVLLGAAAVAVLGVVTGLQLRSPWWQKLLAAAIVVAIAYGLMLAGRRLWRRS